MKISGIMKKENYTAKVNDAISEALKLMDKLCVNGAPVVDSSDSLVGMVVKADIYRFMISPGHYDSCPVEWVMSKSVIFAEADEDIVTAANRLRKNDIISMPVVENGKVIGTVSIEDFLDYLLHLEKNI
jgi:CBS domain-containing protein